MSNLSDESNHGPLNAYNAWSVEVRRGAEVELEEGIPVQFGVPYSTVDHEGISDPSVNLVYEPVGLRIEHDHAWLYVNTEMEGQPTNRNFRWMEMLRDIRLDWEGDLLLVGLEQRKDGALVPAIWSAHRFGPDMEDLVRSEELLREMGITDDA